MRLEFNLPFAFNVRVKGKKVKRLYSLNVLLQKDWRWFSSQKKTFHAQLKKQIKNKSYPLNYGGKIKILYVMGCNSKTDMMNVISVVDKFFQDFLVLEKIIKDDNVSIVDEILIIGHKVSHNDTYLKGVIMFKPKALTFEVSQEELETILKDRIVQEFPEQKDNNLVFTFKTHFDEGVRKITLFTRMLNDTEYEEFTQKQLEEGSKKGRKSKKAKEETVTTDEFKD